MKHTPIMPVLPGTLDGKEVRFVNARLLHAFLGVGRDFSTWIKERIEEFEFVEGEDFSPVSGKSRGGRPAIEYFITLDMAKELSMVERTARGREARRYFIDCERQLRQLQQMTNRAAAVPGLSRAQRQAINRQAWADVAGHAYTRFHARREELLQNLVMDTESGPTLLPRNFRPDWAK